ncbi:hypothetical protein [Peptoniphilus stercorisuis]|uniref:Regulatory protein RecX n=1 Tax=Peptoniphilus stercorisuis TaxID=1436965 RepID=A0ABS4K9Z9_9FIRM|nr:hypothetical protein [Peptoniphilus stercorisuis]MBP2024594.1 hypothetical protein [Peptoniphilus stercorisuis]
MSENYFERKKEERIEKRLIRDLEDLDIDLDDYSIFQQEEIRKYYDEVLEYDSLVANINDKLIYPRVNPENYYSAKIKSALILNHIDIEDIKESDILEMASELVEKVNLDEHRDIEKIKNILEKNNINFEEFKKMYKKL